MSRIITFAKVTAQPWEEARYAVVHAASGAYIGDVVKVVTSEAKMSGGKRYADYYFNRTTWSFEGQGVEGEGSTTRASATFGLFVALGFSRQFAERVSGAWF